MMRSFLLVLLLLMLGVDAQAQTRRALLVGINTYNHDRPGAEAASRGSGTRGVWTDLDGTINDVEAMRAVLTGRYGFEAENVHLLLNDAATREGLFEAIRTHLIEPAQPGDVVFFYYAGHGSQVLNTASDEADQMDESIVPSDSNTGAQDVRDKELRRLFNELLDRDVTLTLIFDSCHSGSVARGLPRPGKKRHVEPDLRDVADPSGAPAIEDRGALIISAAQDDEPASEYIDENGFVRGAFSLAFVDVLRTARTDESAERLFLRARTAMKANGLSQEPVLAGTGERLARPLFGEGGPSTAGVPIPLADIKRDGRILLDGGFAAGLRPGTELAATQGGQTVRLRVTSVEALARSTAEVIEGDPALLEVGMLLDVTRLAPSQGQRLRVWTPPTLPPDRLEAAAQAFASVCEAPVTCVDDPTETPPSHFVQWDGSAWTLTGPEKHTAPLGADADAASLRNLLQSYGAPVDLLVLLPPPPDVVQSLSAFTSDSSAVQLTDAFSQARYALVGRPDPARGTVEYAWVLPAATERTDQLFPLPLRSDWVALHERAGAELERLAIRINSIWSWHQLESPADDTFPYRFAGFERTSDGRLFGATDTLYQGDLYRMVFEADAEALQEGFGERYVYAFVIDSYGESTLVFPRSTGNVGNRIRPAADGEAPTRVTFGDPLFGIGPPYGVDNWFILTTEQPLPNPRVLEFEGIRTRGADRGAGDHPLARLLGDVGAATRGPMLPTPTTWSLERIPVRSLPR